MRALPPLLCAALLCGSCAGPSYSSPEGLGEASQETAAQHLDLAEAEMGRGDLPSALGRLADLREVERLVPEQRFRCESLLERCVELRIAELAAAGCSSDELEDLYELELPARLKALAGTRAAARRLEEGDRIGAAKLVKKVEEALPTHAERNLAGEVLAEAGLSLARDERRYNLLFHYRARGVEALEYLVLTYPFERRCDEAYLRLAEIYEDRGDLDNAIARYEDLLVYHPTSSYAIAAQARLPHVRMSRIPRDDFDRGELLRAQSELETWLAQHPEHELGPWVDETLRVCRGRLASNDLILARYYLRIDQPFGARMHAERALEQALACASPQLEGEARGLLERLPAEEP